MRERGVASKTAWLRAIVAAVSFGAALAIAPAPAAAQQKTFTLDTLMRQPVGGAPDDGFGIWRPVTAPRTRFFGQLDLGFTLNPLRTKTVALNTSRADSVDGQTVSSQLIDYMDVGVELMNRLQLIVGLPIAFAQSGASPTPAGVNGGGNIQGVAAGDMRLDARVVAYRSEDRQFSFGAGLSLYVPTGDEFSFMGDGGGGSAFYVAAETYVRDLILTGNLGVHFRPSGTIGLLTVGNELDMTLGAFLPLRQGKIRIGAELLLSTGIESLTDQTGNTSSTFFSRRNTPLEWLAEGRMFLDEDRRAWAGGAVGTRLDVGYAAPDFRILAAIGYAFTLPESNPTSPASRMQIIRERLKRESGDADHDGIPDDVDLCPSVPEDHLDPDPTDGCPKPSDRDNDGIPDEFDKCPDQPEDKDGIADYDGCPEDDYDADGVPDVSDACPREPGAPTKDPKTNGCPQFIKRVTGSTEIQILKQVQFDTGRATIKPISFPILDEVQKLLVANPDIKRVSIEGHTDNRGSDELNNRLSQQRAESVMNYLVQHGIAADRLEAHGFGPSRPIDTNDTAEGRQNNRRVEFHIVDQSAPKDSGGKGSGGSGNGSSSSGDAPKSTD